MVRPNGHVDWTFLTPSLARPTGGDIALYELASGIARRSRGHVRIVHVPFDGVRVAGLDDLTWFDFEPSIEQVFAPTLDPGEAAGGDVLVYTMKLIASALSPGAGAAGPSLLEAIRADRRLTILFLQGLGVFAPAAEDLALHLPGPKVCVGSRLTSVAVERGVAPSDAIHIANGVDASRFHIERPIRDRTARAGMTFDPHPVKGGRAGIEALALLEAELSVPSTVFGTRMPEQVLPAGLQFVQSPARVEIARIYNTCTLFLQPSVREGFGMSAVEAMSCGCALVTTDNGGADDYAFDGETALVCGPAADDMAGALARLARDDALRIRIATNGSRFVERFRWDASAARLSELAIARLAPTRDQ